MQKCSPVDSDYLLENYFYWGRQLAAGAKGVMKDYDYSDYSCWEFYGVSISSGMCHLKGADLEVWIGGWGRQD